MQSVPSAPLCTSLWQELHSGRASRNERFLWQEAQFAASFACLFSSAKPVSAAWLKRRRVDLPEFGVGAAVLHVARIAVAGQPPDARRTSARCGRRLVCGRSGTWRATVPDPRRGTSSSSPRPRASRGPAPGAQGQSAPAPRRRPRQGRTPSPAWRTQGEQAGSVSKRALGATATPTRVRGQSGWPWLLHHGRPGSKEAGPLAGSETTRCRWPAAGPAGLRLRRRDGGRESRLGRRGRRPVQVSEVLVVPMPIVVLGPAPVHVAGDHPLQAHSRVRVHRRHEDMADDERGGQGRERQVQDPRGERDARAARSGTRSRGRAGSWPSGT